MNTNSITGTAAHLCVAASHGGKNDWFLPSFDELNELYKRRSVVGITTGAYWSSSQGDYDAMAQYFDTGTQLRNLRDATNNVRAVRAF
jgi:hypothetical protein